MQGVKTEAGVLFEGESDEPINASLDDNDNPRYQTDDFRMLYMKVVPCCKRFVHDWSDCPFSHPGEKARRRDPKQFNYTGIACPDMKKTGMCTRGDKCPYAHNVFEYWLHPTRYRSQLCNDGPKCRRRVCFFAHTIDQLRVPPSKPFVAPDMLSSNSGAPASAPHPAADAKPMDTGAPTPEGVQMEAAQQQAQQQQQQQQKGALGSLSIGVSAPEATPFVHSPVAATEPPIRNMSVSTASTTGSIELPLHRSPSAPHVQHEAGGDVSMHGTSSTFMGTQNISFAPPEGYMEVDPSKGSAAGDSRKGTPCSSRSSSGNAIADVRASLATVKAVLRSGAADRNLVIDMLTALLRETLQDGPGAGGMAEAMGLGAGKAAAAGVSAAAAPYDPFTAAATASFDSPWPLEDTTQSTVTDTHAAISAALSAALSGPVQAPLAGAPARSREPAASQQPQQPQQQQQQQQGALAQQLNFRAGPPQRGSSTAGGEAPLGAAPGQPRQSSAPDALLANRSASRALPMEGAVLAQPGRLMEMPRPPLGPPGPGEVAARSGQQQAAAALHQQLVQQMQLRRAAVLSQYKRTAQLAASKGKQAAAPPGGPPGMTGPPSMTAVLEEYSRTGDLRVLQRLSSFMGASPQMQRSFSSDRSYQQQAAAAAAAAAAFWPAGGHGGHFDAAGMLAAAQQAQQQQQHQQAQQQQQQLQPLDMGGLAGGAFDKGAGALRARDLLFPDSFAPMESGGGPGGLDPQQQQQQQQQQLSNSPGNPAQQQMSLGAAFLQAAEMGVPRATSAPVFGGEDYANMGMGMGEMGYAGYMPEHQLLGSSFSGAYDPAAGMGDPGAATGSAQLPLQQSPTQSAFEAGYMAAAQESLQQQQQQQQSGASPNERTPSRAGSGPLGPYMGTHPASMSHAASDSMGGW